MKKTFNFSDNDSYKLKSGTHLSRPILHTTYCGTSAQTKNMGTGTSKY